MSGAETTTGAGGRARGLYAQPAVLLTLATFFWGSNAIAGQLAVGHIGPFTLMTLRGAVAIALLWPLFGRTLRRWWPEIRPKLLSLAILSAVGLTAFNGLFYTASHLTSAVNIGIILGAMPGFVLLGAFLAHGARPGPLQILGVALTAIGVVLIATRGAPLQLLALAVNTGDALILLAAVTYAIYTVALRDRPKAPAPAILLLMTITSTLAGVPFAVAEAMAAGYHPPTLQGWLVTLYIAVLPYSVAQLFFLRGVDLIGPGRAGAFINLVPVFAAGLAVALLGEPFRGFHALSLALVLGGVWLSQRAPRPAPPAA